MDDGRWTIFVPSGQGTGVVCCPLYVVHKQNHMNRKLAIITIVIAASASLPRLCLCVSPVQRRRPGRVRQTKRADVQTGTVPALSIDSPQPAGDTITVAKVALPIHGFVVIRDAATNKIVGASNVIIFSETMNMKIAATVATGKTYIADIHADGDNNGIFDPKLDPPFIVNGKTVTATFKVK